MLPKNRRIPRKLFYLLNKAKTFKNNVFLLKVYSKTEEDSDKVNGLIGVGTGSRFCFSVSKKVAKQAVVRNKLRRTGYSVLSKYLTQIQTNKLIIFYFKMIPKNKEDIDKNIELILKESKLIK